jgi:hypothetical protein
VRVLASDVGKKEKGGIDVPIETALKYNVKQVYAKARDVGRHGGLVMMSAKEALKGFEKVAKVKKQKFARAVKAKERRVLHTGFVIEKRTESKLFLKPGETRKENTSNINYHIKKVPVTESMIKFLTVNVAAIAKEQLKEMAGKYRAGANIYLRMFLENEGKTASIVVKMSKVTDEALYDEIFNKLSHQANKHHDTDDYIIYLTMVSILVSGIGARGGCNPKNPTHTRQKLNDNMVLHLSSHKSSGNNCLITCFNHSYGVAGNVMKPSIVRAALDLEDGEKIDIDVLPRMSDYYNEKLEKKMGYVLINQNNEVIEFYHPNGKKKADLNMNDHDDLKDLVKLCIINEHYYTYSLIIYYKCETCGRQLNSDNKTHTCSKNSASYYRSMILKKYDVVRSRSIEDDKIDYNNVVHWDTETFQKEDGGIRHEVYASAFYYKKKYHVHYGKGSMDKTVDAFLEMENKTISAYNGSTFDFYFLLDKLTDREGVQIENLLVKGGKVMSFSYHTGDPEKKNDIFDLYLFTMVSLEKACKDFKIGMEKGTFEHSKMKSWDDVETYRDEVYPYLETDVMALKKLFETFNDVIYKIKKCNITQFLTASHMGYSMWQSELEAVVEIPKDLEKMAWIRQTIYGGRTYPHQQLYKSEVYDKVIEKKMSYDEVIKGGDFIFNADASSLYPASMSGFEHMKVDYPIGQSRWSDNPAKEYAAGKLGFYEIEFKCPKDIRIPILPRRRLNKGVNIGVEWSLHDGRGVYASIDILNAIESGYDVKFVGKALVYDKKGDVFSTYIKTFYKLKGEAEKDGNNSLRSIAKLLLNSLYGKMLMAPVMGTATIVNNVAELHDFLFRYNMTNYEIMNDNRLMVEGDVKEEEKVKKITKPTQLGSFVTAYSRRIMLFYMKQVDPTLKSQIFTYTDTDSLHISGEAFLILMKKGLIKKKEVATLGFLCSDIDNEGVIIREVNFAPKTYLYEYIDRDGKIDETRKCKGIPKKALKKIDFMMKNTPITFSGLKKKNKLTRADREKGMPLFSVVNQTQTRTFMKSTWKNMKRVGNEYYPHGHEIEGDEEVEDMEYDFASEDEEEDENVVVEI